MILDRAPLPVVEKHSRLGAVLEWIHAHDGIRRRTVLVENAVVENQLWELLVQHGVSAVGLEIRTVANVVDTLASRYLHGDERRMGQIDALLLAHQALASVRPNIANHPRSLSEIALGLRARRNGRDHTSAALLDLLPASSSAAWERSARQWRSDTQVVAAAPPSFWSGFGEVLLTFPAATPLAELVFERLHAAVEVSALPDSGHATHELQRMIFRTSEDECAAAVDTLCSLRVPWEQLAVAFPHVHSESASTFERVARQAGVPLTGNRSLRISDLPAIQHARGGLPFGRETQMSAVLAVSQLRSYAEAIRSAAESAAEEYLPSLTLAAKRADEHAGQLLTSGVTQIPVAVVEALLDRDGATALRHQQHGVHFGSVVELAHGFQHYAMVIGASTDAVDRSAEVVSRTATFLSNAASAWVSCHQHSDWEGRRLEPSRLIGTMTAPSPFPAVPPHEPVAATSPESIGLATSTAGYVEDLQRAGALATPLPNAWNGYLKGGLPPRGDESASALERYANCPFRYFLQSRIGLRPQVDEGFTGLERGNLIHQVLKAAVDSQQCSGDQDMAVILRTVLESHWEVLLQSPAAPIGTQIAYEYRRVEAALQQFLSCYLAARDEGFTQVLGTELRFEGFLLPGTSTTIAGSIDLVLATPDCSRIRVVDYKTGASKNYAAKDRQWNDQTITDHTRNGRRLQLLLYGLVMHAQYPEAAVSSAYWFLDEPSYSKEPIAIVSPEVDWFLEVASTLTNGIAAGWFVPLPEEGRFGQCERCDVRGACATRRSQFSELPTTDHEQLHDQFGEDAPAIAALLGLIDPATRVK